MSTGVQQSTSESPVPGGKDEAENGEPGNGLSDDESFDLLSNRRRRYVLQYLQHNGGAATLGELADRIAAWENDVAMEEVSYDERKRVYTSLQQVHLPRMDAFDVVEFDDREGVVETGPAAESLHVYFEIDRSRGRDFPWSVFYLGLGLFNTCLVGAGAVGVPPLARVSSSGWTVFVLATFLASALVHLVLTLIGLRRDDAPNPPDTRVE